MADFATDARRAQQDRVETERFMSHFKNAGPLGAVVNLISGHFAGGGGTGLGIDNALRAQMETPASTLAPVGKTAAFGMTPEQTLQVAQMGQQDRQFQASAAQNRTISLDQMAQQEKDRAAQLKVEKLRNKNTLEEMKLRLDSARAASQFDAQLSAAERLEKAKMDHANKRTTVAPGSVVVDADGKEIFRNPDRPQRSGRGGGGGSGGGGGGSGGGGGAPGGSPFSGASLRLTERTSIQNIGGVDYEVVHNVTFDPKTGMPTIVPFQSFDPVTGQVSVLEGNAPDKLGYIKGRADQQGYERQTRLNPDGSKSETWVRFTENGVEEVPTISLDGTWSEGTTTDPAPKEAPPKLPDGIPAAEANKVREIAHLDAFDAAKANSANPADKDVTSWLQLSPPARAEYLSNYKSGVEMGEAELRRMTAPAAPPSAGAPPSGDAPQKSKPKGRQLSSMRDETKQVGDWVVRDNGKVYAFTPNGWALWNY